MLRFIRDNISAIIHSEVTAVLDEIKRHNSNSGDAFDGQQGAERTTCDAEGSNGHHHRVFKKNANALRFMPRRSCLRAAEQLENLVDFVLETPDGMNYLVTHNGKEDFQTIMIFTVTHVPVMVAQLKALQLIARLCFCHVRNVHQYPDRLDCLSRTHPKSHLSDISSACNFLLASPNPYVMIVDHFIAVLGKYKSTIILQECLCAAWGFFGAVLLGEFLDMHQLKALTLVTIAVQTMERNIFDERIQEAGCGLISKVVDVFPDLRHDVFCLSSSTLKSVIRCHTNNIETFQQGCAALFSISAGGSMRFMSTLEEMCLASLSADNKIRLQALRVLPGDLAEKLDKFKTFQCSSCHSRKEPVLVTVVMSTTINHRFTMLAFCSPQCHQGWKSASCSLQ
ncbi:hypothetical protein Pelo_16223 [Pelomyxa schiedti]|nr:hypothetical protein Pelo_16223 [Pelomyxa schiedti]